MHIFQEGLKMAKKSGTCIDNDERIIKLYHATSKENAISIVKNGFEIYFDSLEQRLGSGIYFFDQPWEAMEEFGSCLIEVEMKVTINERNVPIDKWIKEAGKWDILGIIDEDENTVIGSEHEFDADSCGEDEEFNFNDLVKEYLAVAHSIRKEKLEKGIKVMYHYPEHYKSTEYVFYDVTFLNSIPRRIVRDKCTL